MCIKRHSALKHKHHTFQSDMVRKWSMLANKKHVWVARLLFTDNSGWRASIQLLLARGRADPDSLALSLDRNIRSSKWPRFLSEHKVAFVSDLFSFACIFHWHIWNKLTLWAWGNMLSMLPLECYTSLSKFLQLPRPQKHPLCCLNTCFSTVIFSEFKKKNFYFSFIFIFRPQEQHPLFSCGHQPAGCCHVHHSEPEHRAAA